MTMTNNQLAVAGNYDVALWNNVVEKTTRNKSTSNRLNGLAETWHVSYTAPSVSAEDDVLLMFKRIQRNFLTIKDSANVGVNGKQGLFIHASQIAYSCMPNTARAFVGDLMVVRASRAIKAGDQLFGTETFLFDNYDQTKTSSARHSKVTASVLSALQRSKPRLSSVFFVKRLWIWWTHILQNIHKPQL